MINKIGWIAILLLLLSIDVNAQDFVEGKVYEKGEDGTPTPLVGANVYWSGTNFGVATDAEGNFKLMKIEEADAFIVSYIGYQNDTTALGAWDYIEIPLRPAVDLGEVEVVHRRRATEISFLDPAKVERIGEKELLKAACCNLSESFETSPSVDVSFTDAVTGTRQIQMLGLAGPYTQITRESMPDVRGLAAIYGLTYTPGPWIEGIQLNKGTGTVTNGPESIAGQINVELRKPEDADRLYLNLFTNLGGRVEANANIAHRFKEKWSTALLLHGKNNALRWDKNEDGFLDMPLNTSLIAVNRWKYVSPKRMRMQLGVKGTHINTIGGQKEFRPGDALAQTLWGMDMKVQRLEGWGKLGFVFEEEPWKTVGLQVSATHHNQDSRFGEKDYNANQNSFYANLLYKSIFNNTNHKFITGASFQYDNYKEQLVSNNFDRVETMPGAYFEYTYSLEDKFNVVAGIRGDYHNIFGAFATPRLHLRYAFSDNIVLRASGGRGQRTANIIAENSGLLASARQWQIQSDGSHKPYGLEAEVAWNYGLNYSHCFRINGKEGTFAVDLYRTDFENQIVVDLDQSPQQAVFYNLDGKSVSNSIQTQIDFEAVKNFDIRMAYRWFDVRSTYDGLVLKKPLIAAHRAFINLAYATENKWHFDFTANWQGKKRIPSTRSNPIEYQMPDYSNDFVLLNAQISKQWWEKFDVYLGMENILGFKQKNPILSSENPYGPNFDASLIWGPIFGRMAYLGLRYKIK